MPKQRMLQALSKRYMFKMKMKGENYSLASLFCNSSTTCARGSFFFFSKSGPGLVFSLSLASTDFSLKYCYSSELIIWNSLSVKTPPIELLERTNGLIFSYFVTFRLMFLLRLVSSTDPATQQVQILIDPRIHFLKIIDHQASKEPVFFFFFYSIHSRPQVLIEHDIKLFFPKINSVMPCWQFSIFWCFVGSIINQCNCPWVFQIIPRILERAGKKPDIGWPQNPDEVGEKNWSRALRVALGLAISPIN